MEQTKAIAGTVVVENTRTGEILALANRPTFNPNLSREIRPERLKNHAVSDVYEPGSTFKLVTIAGALEEKVTRPDELFDCQMGSILFNGMRIHDSRPHGLLTVSDVLAESSDVGSIKIGMRLGEDRFYKYIRAFGFGQQTGIELPGETRGLTKPVSRWSKVSIAAISMGQEIGITPLQLVGLISTMANDGKYVAPRIVAATTQPQSAPQQIAFHPVNEHRVISSLTAAEMRQMMQGVVLHGTGTKARLIGYSSAGKTGTAQKVDPATHAYSHTKYVATFAGFAPVNNPAITVAVVLDSAVGLHQGGQVSAPVFTRITQQVLEYLHTPHDLEIAPSRQVLLAQAKASEKDLDEGSPDHPGDTIEVADAPEVVTPPSIARGEPGVSTRLDPSTALRTGSRDTRSSAINHVITPAALREQVTTPSRAPSMASASSVGSGSMLPSSGTVVLDVEQGGIAVPSFLGKSVRFAIEIAEANGLDLEIVGSGIAQDQSPVAGAHVSSGAKITVRFGR
jgi:membrane peptidoglycan carboxypeptidase